MTWKLAVVVAALNLSGCAVQEWHEARAVESYPWLFRVNAEQVEGRPAQLVRPCRVVPQEVIGVIAQGIPSRLWA